MTKYVVKAVRDENWWLLTAPEVPGVVSQVKRLNQAEEYAREAIAFVLDVPADSFDVLVEPEIEGDAQQQIREARRRLEEAEVAQRDAAAFSRTVVQQLTTHSRLSGAEAAMLLGVSPQRVSQLRARKVTASVPVAAKVKTPSAVRSKKVPALPVAAKVRRTK